MSSDFDTTWDTRILICRICASSNLLINIFVNESHKILEKILCCASVQIVENDGLPQHICTKCFADLETAYAFRTRCEDSDLKFRQRLAAIKHFEDADNCVENENVPTQHNVDNEGNDNIDYASDPEPTVCAVLTETDAEFQPETNERYPDQQEKQKRKSYACETCQEVFEIRRDYFVHIRTHGKQRFRCKLCSKWFSRKSEFLIHKRRHLGQVERVPCNQCSMDFNSRVALLRHIAGIHEQRRDYICDLCGRAFAQKSGLKTHKATHDAAVYSCSTCPAQYRCKRFLRRHEQFHLPLEERNNKFIFKSTTYKPKKAKKRTYVCFYCGKISNNHASHVVHERIHKDERPYPCTVCGKRFRACGILKKHMKTHTDEKPFKCNICGACFREKSHLTTHNLTHSQERKHVCQICLKAFKLKSILKAHLKCHSVYDDIELKPSS
ncbi:zinc finger protein 41 [Topomyia yanbarensis]|uniref:zinc finger protein 41 n=1 Tax=Topomyia yanbarensis TaxID=2498891 RepID=UPI00273ACA2F|nr:zinc finger protein 41 [Topomyia yanbarensis]